MNKFARVLRGMPRSSESALIPSRFRIANCWKSFFAIHDPTTLNRQGADVGTQYRSAIFSHSPEQTAEARALVERLNEVLPAHSPVVTEIVDAPEFFPAEAYHQRYFATNPGQGYCSFVINPKVSSFRRQFAALLRSPDQ